jgi:hypothetical protein
LALAGAPLLPVWANAAGTDAASKTARETDTPTLIVFSYWLGTSIRGAGLYITKERGKHMKIALHQGRVFVRRVLMISLGRLGCDQLIVSVRVVDALMDDMAVSVPTTVKV